MHAAKVGVELADAHNSQGVWVDSGWGMCVSVFAWQ